MLEYGWENAECVSESDIGFVVTSIKYAQAFKDTMDSFLLDDETRKKLNRLSIQ